MPNLTSVTLTAGVPTAGTGTVSTIDALLAVAATAALQSTGNTSLANVDTSTATLAAAIVAQGTALGTIKQQMAGGSVTTAAPTYTTGQISPLSLDTAGGLRVSSHAVTNAGTFAVQDTVLDAAIIAQATALGSIKQLMVGGSVTTAAPIYTTGTINPASIDTAGNLRVVLPSTQVTSQQTASKAMSDGYALVALPSDQPAITVKGSAASGATASGNPVPAAGLAVSSETAVTNGQAAALITDLARKLIVLPYANPENFVSGAITSAMTGTTSISLVAAPASGLRNYITTIICSNAHATVGTDIIIQDGSGGTTLLTIPAAAVYGGAVITLPTPLRQPTTATAIYCANVTTGASTKVSAVGYKGA